MAIDDEKKKVVKYKFPKTIGACLARIAKLQTDIDNLSAQLAPFQAEYGALREYMIAQFKKDDLNGAKGSGRSVSIVKSVVPQLEDWDSFFKYAKKKGNEDLLPRNVSTDAWRERVNAGKEVPGVNTFTRIGLRINKVAE